MSRALLRLRALRYLLIAATAFLSVVIVSCGLESRANYDHEVEIAPGKWLTLKERRGYCWFVCEYNGRKVNWEGKRDTTDELELPKTLREYEGNLYMIVFNRENMDAAKYVYFKLDESGVRFEEIPSSEFPKQVAIENIVGPRTRMVGVGDKWVDTWEVLKKLEVEHPYFPHCATANIWIELETGKSLKEIRETLNYEEKRKLVLEYKEKYQPVAVPTLVKEETSSSE